LAPTDGLLMELGGTSRVVVRPSGTEPKLKAYIEIVGGASDPGPLEDRRGAARAKLEAVRDDLATILKL
jgi:phosphomannomutase